jgi:AcrR family transcriptional regulator
MSTSNGDRRLHIITAALQVIAQQSVAQITTRKIAHAADIRLATLHYYFESKDDLLFAVLDEVTDRMIAALQTPFLPRDGLHEALARSITTLYVLIEQPPYLPRVRCELILYLSHSAGYTSRVTAQQRRYTVALQTLYDDACGASGTRSAIPLDLLAELVRSQVEGLAISLAASEAPERLMRIREYLLQAALALVEGTHTGTSG